MRNLVLEDEVPETSNNVSECDVDTNNQYEKTVKETVDLRQKLKNIDKTNVSCSFELFPTKNYSVYQNFFAEMNKYSPLFYALTWHEKGSTNNYLSLELAEMFPSNVLMHLAAADLTRNTVELILKNAIDCKMTNIFALRGDSAVTNSDFPYAVDLVSLIRNRFGDKFCICVAGYPEMHPESNCKELDLFYLKKKVDAGADFIITQIVFEANVFINFVKDCRDIGINVPIIAGIFPIPDYKTLQKMTKICSVKVPKNILDSLQHIKDNDEAVRNFGVELSLNIIKDVFKSGTAHGFHLFTLNRISLASEICDRLSLSH